VTDPSIIESFSAGSSVNPRYPLRTAKSAVDTAWLDTALEGVKDTTDLSPYTTLKTAEALDLLEHVNVDQAPSPSLWDMRVIKAALEVLKNKMDINGKPVYGDKVNLVVKRGRDLRHPRSERAGIIGQQEGKLAPADAPTLFMYRTNKHDKELGAWWPQLRFPGGNYILAFSFDW
jgi:hypothetical protein